ncbi:MAG: Undecaprenyl-diphosphatase [Firmicutes bacterium ADurb.Bin182]|nr:MAG: Undecaprenyl-diphosphatase [Firmicutes bacterium ADurb.Bin182]
MSVLIALLLGAVQGLCEFLPVSSSGHLVLIQNVFGISENVLFFDTMLHLGTLIAVFAVYWEQIINIIRHPIQKKTGMLLISTVITTAIAFTFRNFFESSYEGTFLGFGFLFTAIVLFLTERIQNAHKNIGEMKVHDSVMIGIMQGVAIMPGISRSGSTIAGAMYTGLKRSEAADFSFLLSIPAILGSVIMQVPEVAANGIGPIDLASVITGTAAAAATGYFAIKFMLKIIVRKGLKGFAIYVAALGAFVLLDQFALNLFFTRPF